MSRPQGSNKLTVSLKCAKAGLLWMKGWPISWISKELKVTPRMVHYYLFKWSNEGHEILDFLKLHNQMRDELEEVLTNTKPM